MTFRAKPVTTRRRRTPFENEERTQFWVTLGFIGVVLLAILILGGAVAAGYYNDHFRPVARVQGTEINRDAWLDRQKVETFRLKKAEGRIREALASGRLDEQTANGQLQALNQRSQNVSSEAIEGLIDEALQGQIAGSLGISATPQEVDAKLAEEARTPELRKVLAIFVQPEIGDQAEAPTKAQKDAAKAEADKALAELKAGKSFAEVATTYSTDASKDRGGEYGYVVADNPTDEAWVTALFELELNGTTEVVEGADGVSRIGRVTEIVPGQEDTDYQKEIEADVNLAAYRRAVEGSLIEEKLRDKISREATTGNVDQVHAYEILVEGGQAAEGAEGALPDAEGEVRASHILQSPNDSPEGAAEVAEDDPAWEEAKKAADRAAADLRKLTNVENRKKQFEELAKSESDDTSAAENGGDLGFFTRATMVQEFAEVVFDKEHEEGEIIGPVRTQFGWHVILFQEKRPPATTRIQEIVDLLKDPAADFEAIARQRSDGENAAEGGEIGWVARYQLEKEIEDVLFGLQEGKVSEAIQRDDGFHVYKVTERAKRPVDANQKRLIEQNAFDVWYQPQKDAAEASIFRDEEVLGSGEAEIQ